MEHRHGTRRRLDMTVLVRRRGWGGSVVARLADVSISGAYLVGPADAFPLHSLVQLEASPPGGASTRLMHCRAMVARIGPDGVGLVFDQVRPPGLSPLFGTAGAAPARDVRPSGPTLPR